jgi:hypothetical protein
MPTMQKYMDRGMTRFAAKQRVAKAAERRGLAPEAPEAAPAMPPEIPVPRAEPTVATPEQAVITRGGVQPSEEVDREQAMEDIAVKRAQGQPLTEDDLRTEFRAAREVGAPGAPLTRDPYMPEEFAALSAEQVASLPPAEQARYQQYAEHAQAQRAREFQQQMGGEIEGVFGEQIAGAEEEQAAAQERIQAENQQLLDEFRGLREEMQAGTIEEVREAGTEAQEKIQAMMGRRGFGRSSATAEQLRKASATTQRRVQEIENQTGMAVSQYQVQLLDRLDNKMAKYEARVEKYKDAKSQAKLAQAQQEIELAQKIFETDPTNPANIAELAGTLIEIKAAEDKATQAALKEKFEKGMEYGYVPEFTPEEGAALSANFGVPPDEFPQLMADMQQKAQYEKMAENIEYETDNEGNVTALMFNTQTGDFDRIGLGQIGKGVEKKFQLSQNPVTGETMIFDPLSGQVVGRYSAFGQFSGTGVTAPSGTGSYTGAGGATDANILEAFKGKGDWCGYKASEWSDAGTVGDYWSSKKNAITHTSNPTSGDKLLIPLGVKSGVNSYGHVAVVLDYDANTGEIKVIEANAGGEINRCLKAGGGMTACRAKGKITVGSYNLNTLNKKYPGNWGFRKGNFKGKYKNALEALPKAAPAPAEAQPATEGGLMVEAQLEAAKRYPDDIKKQVAFVQTVQRTGQIPKDIEAEQREIEKAEKLDEKTFERADKLRDEFNAMPTVKDFKEVRDKVADVKAIVDTGIQGPADLAIVFAFMKALDPSSVVRESEYSSAAQSGGIFRGTWEKFNGAFQEGQFLPEDVKQDFLTLVQSSLNTKRKSFEQDLGRYNDLAQKSGVDTDYVTYDYTEGIDEILGGYAREATTQPTNTVQTALSEGYTYDDILNYYKQSPEYAAKIQAAIDAGYNAQAIVEFLQ